MKDNTAVYSDKRCLFQAFGEFLFPQSRQKSLLNLSQAISYPFKDQQYQVQIFKSIDEVPQAWDALIGQENLFLGRQYLEVLERNRPKDMLFSYVIYLFKGRAIGINIFQSVRFNLAENINGDKPKSLIGKTGESVKSAITKRVNFRLLVSGNMLLTGEHGFYFTPGAVNEEKRYELVAGAIEQVRQQHKKDGVTPISMMIKDIEGDHRSWTDNWTAGKYNEVIFQPNMVLDFHPEWTCFEDYLAAMSSKYRVRVRRARKKGAHLECREFSLEDIEQNLDQIHALYLRIAEKAGFNMIQLNKDYFYALKENFPDTFRMHAYFEEGVFRGFCTTIHNGDELEAHFLGFEEDVNHSCQLYLNMLYDMIDIAFNTEGVTKVVFARTAMEIKSSVGAVAHDMYCYFKLPNNPINGFVPGLISLFEPKIDWKPRHPFKS